MDRLYQTLRFTTGFARAAGDMDYPNEDAIERITRNIPAVAMKHFERVLMKVMDTSQVH